MVERLVVVDDWFRQKLWFLDWDRSIRLTGCSIKVEPNGYLCILKAISAEGPLVAFVGSNTFENLWRTLQQEASRAQIKWREDKFALDNLEKKR